MRAFCIERRRLPDCSKLVHQCMIEAGEMLLLQRLHDGRSKRDRAGLDRVARVLAALDQNFRKDRERVFDKFAAELFEVRLYESIVDFVQRPRELFAVTTSPLA